MHFQESLANFGVFRVTENLARKVIDWNGGSVID